MINDNQWLEFIGEADTYSGPLTIGQLFCKLFEVKDPEIALADNDTVWQLIVNKYRKKD
jgi:hypothetical protein